MHRLIEYDAGVMRIAPAQIAEAITKLLTVRRMASIAIPEGLPAEWQPAGFQFVHASALDAQQLDKLDGALTGCTVAIAETGSIVLQNAVAQGPRALSLVPDYHLCVVFASQVVETVPECFARLDGTANLPTTFFPVPRQRLISR